MNVCARPGCELPAKVKYCSRACAGLDVSPARRAEIQEKGRATLRRQAIARHQEAGSDRETSERVYKLGYMKCLRKHNQLSVLRRLLQVVSSACAASAGSRTPAVPPGRR